MYSYDPKYSLLIYQREITPTIISMIKHYLKHGVKIYFLTLDPIERILEDLFLNQAYKKDLLRAYELLYKEEFAAIDEVFVDGAVTDKAILSYFTTNSSFNGQQYEIEHDISDCHSMIKAGAGTGKTTVMLDRLLALKHLQPMFSFRQLVMITFTNESATHMKKKLMDRLYYYYELTKQPKYYSWIEELSDLKIGTIHSFAKTFLTVEGSVIGLYSNITVRSYKHEKRRLIEHGIDQFAIQYPEVYQHFKYVPQYEIVQSITTILNTLSNKALSNEEIKNLNFGEEANKTNLLIRNVVMYVQQALYSNKQDEQALEMNDLISELKKIAKQKLTKPKWSISYIMVDEFQDSDEAQVSFIAWLSQLYQCRLFVVGDVKQSIYRFRGADYTAFDQLKEKLSQAQVIERSLVKNYRSTAPLLENLDSLFRTWANKIELFSYTNKDALMSTIPSTEHESFVSFKMFPADMKQLLRRLYEKEVAVLVRSNREVDQAVTEIESHGFFCDAKRSGTFYRSIAVREFYMLVRRFTHPTVWRDRYALHKSSYGENKLGPAIFLKQFTDEKIYQGQLLESFEQFDDEQYLLKTVPPLIVLEKMISKCKPEDVYRKRMYSKMRANHPEQDCVMQQKEALLKMKEYKMNLEHLLFLLKNEFATTTATLPQIERYLRIQMATNVVESELKITNSSHRIEVMTVHQAKGQEYDYVLLPYTENGFLNNSLTRTVLVNQNGTWELGYKVTWKGQTYSNTLMENHQSTDNKEIIAEETRLLYVALTRAKKAIFANSLSDFSQVRSVTQWSHLLTKGSEQLVSS